MGTKGINKSIETTKKCYKNCENRLKCFYRSDIHTESWYAMKRLADDGSIQWIQSDPGNKDNEIHVIACFTKGCRLEKCDAEERACKNGCCITECSECKSDGKDFILIVRNNSPARWATRVAVGMVCKPSGKVSADGMDKPGYMDIWLAPLGGAGFRLGKQPHPVKSRTYTLTGLENCENIPVTLGFHVVRDPSELQDETNDIDTMEKILQYKNKSYFEVVKT